LLALLTAVVVAACGSSSSGAGSGSGTAQSLLKQTFSGSHTVKSGVLSFSLTLTPTGSSMIKGPISLALSGPFQSRGSGKLPASNFNISIGALGHHGQIGVVSTGANGYITLDGTAYQLPAADFQRLDSSFSGVAGGSGTGGLSKLGIKPLQWLSSPSIVGTETVGGDSTTHIRASINVASLLGDLSTFLQKASASGAAGSTKIPTTISPADRQKIASEVKNPTVDIWTGTSDKTLRKLSINLSVPVSGQASTRFGGLSSAGIGMTLQYANLNQSQTIAAPTNVQPFTGFATKIQAILQQVERSLGATALGSAGSTGSTGSTGSGSTGASSAGVQNYTKCIQQAAGDVTKMQKCASLLSGSSG
jgi:hypothetical protein